MRADVEAGTHPRRHVNLALRGDGCHATPAWQAYRCANVALVESHQSRKRLDPVPLTVDEDAALAGSATGRHDTVLTQMQTVRRG